MRQTANPWRLERNRRGAKPSFLNVFDLKHWLALSKRCILPAPHFAGIVRGPVEIYAEGTETVRSLRHPRGAVLDGIWLVRYRLRFLSSG